MDLDITKIKAHFKINSPFPVTALLKGDGAYQRLFCRQADTNFIEFLEEHAANAKPPNIFSFNLDLDS